MQRNITSPGQSEIAIDLLLLHEFLHGKHLGSLKVCDIDRCTDTVLLDVLRKLKVGVGFQVTAYDGSSAIT